MNHTFSGDGLGFIKEIKIRFLEPVLNYKLILPENCNIYELYKKLCKLEEEDPQLHIVWEEQLKEIYIQVMGEVQIEVLKCIIFERFHISVDFGSSNIVYKETITEPVVGIGHFEPLKHYAEVHVLMEPLERGSGLKFLTKCSEDILNKNWQRLIITHLEEKKHIGVLTGSEITDIGKEAVVIVFYKEIFLPAASFIVFETCGQVLLCLLVCSFQILRKFPGRARTAGFVSQFSHDAGL